MKNLLRFSQEYSFYYENHEQWVELVRYVGSQSELAIPDKMDNLPIKSIGENCFEECVSLTKVEIPDSIHELGEGAFTRCLNLQNIRFSPNIEKLKANTFMDCIALEQLNVPSGVKIIEDGCFRNAVKLHHVSIPNTIQQFSFSQTSVRTVEIEEGVSIIDVGAFAYCSEITQIKMPNSIKILKDRSFFECKNLKKIEFSDHLEHISERAFKGCEALEEIILPDSTQFVDETAFEDCKSVKRIVWKGKFESVNNWPTKGAYSVEEIEFGDEITEINIKQRYNNLKKVVFPKHLKKLSYSCLSEIYAQQSNEDFVTLNGTLLIKYKGKDEHVTIPSNITQLLEFCFSQSSIKSITFNADITEIPEGCFKECRNIKHFEVPSSIKAIRVSGFSGCENLTDIKLNEGLLEIESDAFSGCKKLDNILLPNSLQRVGHTLFDQELNIASLTIPPSLTSESIKGRPFNAKILEIHFSNPRLILSNCVNFSAIRQVHYHHPNGLVTSFNTKDLAEEYHPFLHTLEFRNNEFILNIFKLRGTLRGYGEFRELVDQYKKYLHVFVIDDHLKPFIFKNTELEFFEPLEVLKELINEQKAERVQLLLSNKYVRVFIEDQVDSILESAVASGSASVVAILMNTYFADSKASNEFEL